MAAGATGGSDEARFSAFVSYSHADAAIAKKLHRKIETYKLPKSLRDIGDSDRDTGRLGQIFRDREDLPAALDLSESVKAALTRSQALIVLCSPDAKNSPWVNREIDLFRELHPDRPVLAALVAGEPTEAFPEALTRLGEPLAADLRKQGDGWRLGVLKLVAGIAGVPLDSLVQRDAQRHIRNVTAVTLVVGAALLAMIGMTYFAIQQRNEAQHQQAQAEGLVEYMLTDLRSELRGVGRLDVMTNVNERAMDYYEDQGDLADMSAESLERRARILHAMGEDDQKRGDLSKALLKFTEAHRVTEELLARDPENADRIFGHAQSEYWVGRVHELRKEHSSAKNFYSKYADLAALLYEKEPNQGRSLMELGYAASNLGILALEEKRQTTQAVKQFEEAIFWFERALTQNPDNQTIWDNLANAYAWKSDSHFAAKQLKLAKTSRLIELKYHRKLLARDPNNLYLQHNLLVTEYALNLIAIKEGKIEIGQKSMEELYVKALKYRNIDRTNEEWAQLIEKIKSHI